MDEKDIERLRSNLKKEIKYSCIVNASAAIFTILSAICFLVSKLAAIGIILAIPAVIAWYIIYLCRGSVERMKNELYKAEIDRSESSHKEIYWDINPTYKKIGFVTIALILIVVGVITSPKLSDSDGSSNNSNNSDSSYRPSGIQTSCAYRNCPDYAQSGSRYCSRHTCKIDGCNEKVKDPIIGYCPTHDKEETCIEPGCHGNKYKAKDSDYCTIHYGDHIG